MEPNELNPSVASNSPQPSPAQPAVQMHMAAQSPQRPITAVTSPSVQTAEAPRAQTSRQFVLSLAVATRSDLSKCLREMETLEDFFHQAGLRNVQAKEVPRVSLALESLASANQLNLLVAQDRGDLMNFLARVKAKAPVVHLSFPSEASGDFIARILEWFRTEVHPFVLLHIGLQPELAAGCVVRTTNKMFDFSFRNRFEKSKQLLIAALEASA